MGTGFVEIMASKDKDALCEEKLCTPIRREMTRKYYKYEVEFEDKNNACDKREDPVPNEIDNYFVLTREVRCGHAPPRMPWSAMCCACGKNRNFVGSYRIKIMKSGRRFGRGMHDRMYVVAL